MKNQYYQQLELAFKENWPNETHHLAKYNIVKSGYVKSLSREKWKTYITNITEYGFNQLKSKQTNLKKNT